MLPLIETRPLSTLTVSKANARKGKPPAKDVAQMEASILGHGLQHNLVVSADGEVIAGQVRLLALQALADKGHLDPDVAIPCALVDTEADMEEISLAENIVRLPIHPADQVAVFARLQRAGATVEDLAQRFAYTPRTIEQRLRLGALHATVLKAYRRGDMDLDMAQAFTLTLDKKRQLEVWTDLTKRGDWNRTAHAVRQALLGEKFPIGHHLVTYAGLERYEAEGGTVTRDLFSSLDEDRGISGAWVDDPDLLRRLAQEKLDKYGAQLRRRGWKWVEVEIGVPWEKVHSHARIDPAGDKGKHTDEQKAVAGVLVDIGGNGRPECHEGLVKKEDLEEAWALTRTQKRARRQAEKTRGDEADDEPDDEEEGTGTGPEVFGSRRG